MMTQNKKLSKPLRVISISGGKGGVGKTTLSVNLAVAFSKMGKKTLLFDADLGLANVDVMLGLNPQKTIYDFLMGKCSLTEVCLTGPHGLKIIPSASGIQQMAELSSEASGALIRSFSALTEDIEMMIIDLASGISSQVIDLTHASQDIIMVISNDHTSLTDSYAVIKILHKKYARKRFGIIVNKATSLQESYDVFSRFQTATAKFFEISLHFLGFVPLDDYLRIASHERVSVIDQFPGAISTESLYHLCHGINQWNSEEMLSGGIQFFFERLIHDRVFDKESPCMA